MGPMKAIELTDQKDPSSLELVDLPTPQPAEGEVLVKVHAAGVNRADLLQAQGNYPPPKGASEIIGLEVAGTIADANGTSLTESQEVACLLAGGGYAEYVAVPEGQIAPIPEPLSLTDAAGIMEVACTVWSNLGMPAGIHKGQRVLIHGGGGGIGSMAIQIAKAAGCEVAVTAGSERKLAHCRDLGADILINYHEQDFAEELKDSVDVILDIIGAKYLAKNLTALADDGQLVIMGMQGGSKAELNINYAMSHRLDIHFRTLRSRTLEDKATIVTETTKNVWPMLKDGLVRHHVDAVLPLAQAKEAHRRLNDGEIVGKVVLEV